MNNIYKINMQNTRHPYPLIGQKLDKISYYLKKDSTSGFILVQQGEKIFLHSL